MTNLLQRFLIDDRFSRSIID